MRVDLHTHSRVSDGTQSPRELVQAAKAAGLDVLALTDHDTAAGWAEAATAAEEVGLQLVPGMEVSTTYRGRGVHLLAYLPDPTHPDLAALLTRVLQGRDSRVPEVLARLRALGIGIEQHHLDAVSGDAAATGRPHVADALVALGAVADRTEAFDRYLAAGRPAYVDRWAAPLLDTLAAVSAAGGVAVVAHPWGRHDPGVLDAEGLEVLRDAGLVGIEVDHRDHGSAERAALRGIAEDLDLVVTGSSDHHGLGKVDHELGCHTTAPDQLERLLDLAAGAAAASGRTTPTVVGR
ncbi:PHP domain-containing protein [Nocardioides perillae]|uniref:Polymerase/histidinol phosphatase N-terminal domain-containing protein n=1 Tax=Nocardioides perillae TaxID=1119534 RepID=A0A7Y9UMB4_9ACTN|nr:hypothetical protein [Nocardioides perillae]